MKKVLSLVLAVVLVLGLSTVAFAFPYDAGGRDFTDPAIQAIRLGSSNDLGTLNPAPAGVATNEVEPDTTYRFFMYVSGTGGQPITRRDVTRNKLGVRIRATEGNAAIDSAKIVYETHPSVGSGERIAVVELSLVEKFVSTKELDFNVILYATANKKRIEPSEVVVDGTLANNVTDVYEGDDLVNLEDTPVVEAHDYIRDIQVELGEGVSLYTKMFEGKKYYGAVSQDVKTEDEAVLAQYPDIDTVYYLTTIGLGSTGNIVGFDLENNYYVYVQDADGNLVYLGRSNDRLQYFTKYFLSLKELDVDVIADEDLEPGDDGDLTPGMGGDDALPNINDNPSTGR